VSAGNDARLSRVRGVAEISSLKVLLAHGVADARDAIRKVLSELQNADVQILTSGRQLVETALETKPNLIITGVDLPDLDGVTALLKISEQATIPAIIVTQQKSLETVQRAMEDHVMAYLIEPVHAAEILPTIHLVMHRFEQFQELREEVENLKQALTDRKQIERAKGVLMRRADIDEDTAYKRLRRMATDNRIRMSDAAERVLSVEGALDP
jgi:AmiR/NasT family two-component response regulator